MYSVYLYCIASILCRGIQVHFHILHAIYQCVQCAQRLARILNFSGLNFEKKKKHESFSYLRQNHEIFLFLFQTLDPNFGKLRSLASLQIMINLQSPQIMKKIVLIDCNEYQKSCVNRQIKEKEHKLKIKGDLISEMFSFQLHSSENVTKQYPEDLLFMEKCQDSDLGHFLEGGKTLSD